VAIIAAAPGFDPAATAITATGRDGASNRAASDATRIMAMASGGASDPAVQIATTDVTSLTLYRCAAARQLQADRISS